MRSLKWIKIYSLFIAMSFIVARPAFAEEEKSGEAPKLERPEIKEWHADEGRTAKLKSNIEKSKAELNELFENQSKIKDPALAVTASKEILEKSEELKKDIAEYRELRLHIRFKHPEKGNFSKRNYQREEIMLPDESHFDLSLQGKLDKIKSNVEAHYSIEHKKKLGKIESLSERKPASVDSNRIVLAK
jgi:hypothetical protein